MGSLGRASHTAPAALPLDVPPPVHVPRSGVLLSSDARQSHHCFPLSFSRSCVNVLPVERYATLVHSTASTPPQPMDQREVSPPGLEEA